MATLGFVGDVYPGTGDVAFTPEVARRLATFDLLVGNLEGPLTAVSRPAVEKGTLLRSSPGSVSLLGTMNLGLAGLANNHMFDFGIEGFEDTTRLLDASGIPRVGSGADLGSARHPLTMTVDGLTLGFLAYSSPLIETEIATDRSAGSAPAVLDVMLEDVAALDGAVDAIVVLVHWGLTGYALPTPSDREAGLRLLDAGATLVVGSHPHVLQGVERRGRGLVAYSLGDFAFFPEIPSGRRIHRYRARQTGALLEVELTPGGVGSHQLVLTRQDEARVVRPERSRARHRAARRAARRLGVGATRYAESWRRYVLRRTILRAAGRLAPWKWRTIRPGTVKGLGVALRELRRR